MTLQSEIPWEHPYSAALGQPSLLLSLSRTLSAHPGLWWSGLSKCPHSCVSLHGCAAWTCAVKPLTELHPPPRVQTRAVGVGEWVCLTELVQASFKPWRLPNFKLSPCLASILSRCRVSLRPCFCGVNHDSRCSSSCCCCLSAKGAGETGAFHPVAPAEAFPLGRCSPSLA